MPLTDQLSEKELSRIFNLLKHPLRREILRRLSKNSQTYSQLLRKLNVKESSFLNYHLRKMDGLLIEKNDDGKYKLSEIGEICSQLALKIKEKEDIDRFDKFRQLVENLKLTVLGTQIILFLLVIVLLSELTALNVVNTRSTIRYFAGGIAFSSVLLFFIGRKYRREAEEFESKEKIGVFLLILTIYILVQTIIQIAFKLL